MTAKIKIKDLKETALIKDIRRWLGPDFLGDDCAVLPGIGAAKNILATADALVENIHFKIKNSNWPAVGFKAIAVNVSDLAAMGGRPKYALISLGLRPEFLFDDLKNLYRGLKQAARFYGLAIVGGNLSRSPINFIDVFMMGESGQKVLRRSGARPGDRLFLTGYLGKAASKNYRVTKADYRQIRLQEGIFMAANNLAGAAIDLSDGLVKSVEEITAESRVGARIFIEKIPRVKNLSLEKSLKGGDDFELLLAVPERLAAKTKKMFRARFKTKLSEIGVITRARSIKYRYHGRTLPMAGEIFHHF